MGLFNNEEGKSKLGEKGVIAIVIAVLALDFIANHIKEIAIAFFSILTIIAAYIFKQEIKDGFNNVIKKIKKKMGR